MSMIRHYYRNTHAIVFVYDVTNMASFESLKKWVVESNNNCLSDVPRILVGNKCDGVIAVSTNIAQKFADQNNMPVIFLYYYLVSSNVVYYFSYLKLQQDWILNVIM